MSSTASNSSTSTAAASSSVPATQAGDVSSMSSVLLVHEARARGMTAKVLQPRLKLTQLTYVDHAGAEQRVLIRNTRCELVSAVGALVADDKAATLALAREHGLPVPTTEPFRSPEQARAFLEREGRIVVKPSDAGHGDGVTTNLTTFDAVMRAVEFAKKHTKGPSGGGGSGEVLLQTHCDGDDYRVLVVGGKMVAATHRMPAFVVGDGEQSIGALIAQKNADPRRGTGHDAQLTVIDAAEAAEYLASSASGRSLETVPSSGERVNVLGVANLSRGGESRDVTDVIHPELVELCERFARVAGLGVCGADLVCRDITKPASHGSCAAGRPAFMELNAAPGIRMHHFPTEGTGRNVAGAILDHIVYTRRHSDMWRSEPW